MSKDEWRKHFTKQPQSGLSVRAYCKQYGLREPYFYKYRKLLSSKKLAKFKEIEINNSKPSQTFSFSVSINSDRSVSFSGKAPNFMSLMSALGGVVR